MEPVPARLVDALLKGDGPDRADSRRFLDSVLAQMPSGVVVADAGGRVLLANARMDEIAGRPGRFDLDEVREYAAWQGWRPDGSPIAPEEWPLSRALAKGETVTGEQVRVRRADGTDRWCRVSASPVRDASGAIVGAVAIVDDMTRELEAQAALRLHRERLEALIAAQGEMGDAILVTQGARIAWANDAFLRLLGVTREEVESPTFDAFAFVPPEDVARMKARGEERLTGRRLHEHYEMRVRRRDGTIVPVEVSSHAEVGSQGTRVTAVFRDIAARRRAEEELAHARAELARSEKLSALGSLVGGVAHELRTPLTYLSTNLALVERGMERVLADAAPDRREDARMRVLPRLADAREAIDRIDRLVEDLRKFTRLKPSERGAFDLAPVVDEAVGLFRATRRGEVGIEADLRPTPLRQLDRVEVQQVVLNLLENAREARPRDGVVRIRTYADARGRPVLEVADRGAGIPEDVKARIFDAFYTTKPEGTGLGLSIVRRIAESHGAFIECDSAPGEGTTFRVVFA